MTLLLIFRHIIILRWFLASSCYIHIPTRINLLTQPFPLIPCSHNSIILKLLTNYSCMHLTTLSYRLSFIFHIIIQILILFFKWIHTLFLPRAYLHLDKELLIRVIFGWFKLFVKLNTDWCIFVLRRFNFCFVISVLGINIQLCFVFILVSRFLFLDQIININ